MQPLTGEIVTLKNVFTLNLETKPTSTVYWLTLYDHVSTVGLSFGLGLFIMSVAFLLLVNVNQT